MEQASRVELNVLHLVGPSSRSSKSPIGPNGNLRRHYETIPTIVLTKGVAEQIVTGMCLE